MRSTHITVLAASDASINQTSTILDVRNCITVSVEATVAGVSALSATVALQVSNAVPPPGAIVGQTWSPPASSWVQAYSGGSAITVTLTGNGSTLLGIAADGSLSPWVRAVYTNASGGTGGTIQLDGFARGLA
jgi:hypothetical protein